MEKSSESVSPPKARELNFSEDYSWNFYIERFYSDNTDDETNCIASSVEKVTSHAGSLIGMPSKGKSFEKVCCGKRKRKGHLVYDDALQDTASSPVYTPKEEIINHSADLNKRIKEMGVFREDKEHTEVTKLKKIGFCLVPLSLAEKYVRC